MFTQSDSNKPTTLFGNVFAAIVLLTTSDFNNLKSCFQFRSSEINIINLIKIITLCKCNTLFKFALTLHLVVLVAYCGLPLHIFLYGLFDFHSFVFNVNKEYLHFKSVENIHLFDLTLSMGQ